MPSFKSIRKGVDVSAEVEQLRKRYDDLSMRKEKEEIRRSTAIDATDVQRRLYEEGRIKLISERTKEVAGSSDRSNVRTRDPLPISVCNRLYEEGMSKVSAEKEVERQKAKEMEASLRLSRNPSPIPVCDRLYEEGMSKVRAGRSTKREGSGTRRPRQSISPFPICDRLYEQGMAKLKSRVTRSE